MDSVLYSMPFHCVGGLSREVMRQAILGDKYKSPEQLEKEEADFQAMIQDLIKKHKSEVSEK